MRLSILVVSRNPTLLNAMLSSLSRATVLEHADVEILCSWNGDSVNETKIENTSRYEFLIAQRQPYHFASNMNALAKKANGEMLLLINDDVILDSQSIDAAIHCIEQETNAGIVGGRLRNKRGLLTHAGILFDSRHSPYHQLNELINADELAAMGNNRPMPAVTGALLLIRNAHFNTLHLNENYKTCGEDVELCIDLRQKLNLEVLYCPQASGIHEGEETRKDFEQQQGNTEDLSRMRMVHRQFLKTATFKQLYNDLMASTLEAEGLRSVQGSFKAKEKDLRYWQEQSHSLQLIRLRQQDQLNQLQSELKK